MSLEHNSRKKNLQKTWGEVARVTNKVNENIKIISIENLISHDFRTTRKYTIIEDFLIGNGSYDRYMFITEFPGMSERSVAHAQPLIIITPTDQLNPPTAEGSLSDVTTNFFYTWEAEDKRDADGEKTGGKTMFFKCWVSAKHQGHQPFKLKIQMVFHNRNHYDEIQINKA